MQLGNQVEWALHCCTVLAWLPANATLKTAAMAEFHGVPKAYLAKALQRLAEAKIVNAVPGPKGGYQLAKPADEITLLDIVEAVEGKSPTFVCTEIRCNNPCGIDPEALNSKCLIAEAMHQADQAWRKSLTQKTLHQIKTDLEAKLSPQAQKKNADWFLKHANRKQ